MKHFLTACSLVALLGLVSACCSCSKEPEPRPATGGTIKTAAKNPDGTPQKNADGTPVMIEEKLPMTEAEWKKKLTPEQYRVLRESGTERAFTGKYDKTFEDGTYTCAGCGEVLFLSDSKFDSGCGWPAFSKAGVESAITEISDESHGMTRVEVRCKKCGGHLGHVFDDGPAPTGRRYCINSASLDFTKKK